MTKTEGPYTAAKKTRGQTRPSYAKLQKAYVDITKMSEGGLNNFYYWDED